jgi:hypothetical protein
MGTRELKARYGTNGGTAAALNRAIRAEIPGGAETLDALELAHQIVSRTGELESDGRTPTIAQVFHDRLSAIANAMDAEVRRRYTMPPMD